MANDLVERVARALHAVEESWNDMDWEYVPASCQALFRRQALAALKAIGSETERVCDICKAVIAKSAEAMACHCTERPWRTLSGEPE